MDAAGAQWMAVNANGILTRPQTPYMRGQITGKANPHNEGGAALKVIADVNFGGYWNNATGLFTCPIAGKYMLTAGNIASNQAGYLNLRRNNADVHFTHWNHGASWHYVSLSAVVVAAANDYFSWHLTGLTPATAGFFGSGGHCMYSIALMA